MNQPSNEVFNWSDELGSMYGHGVHVIHYEYVSPEQSYVSSYIFCDHSERHCVNIRNWFAARNFPFGLNIARRA